MDPLAVIAIIGLGLAALALFNGIVSMAHGGEADQRSSHWLMLKRIGWQGLAVLAVLLALLGYLR
jgi:hypothetical protein